MEAIPLIAQALGSGWASGLNLYATVTALGLLGRYDLVELGGRLEVVENPWVIGIAGVMYVAEFVADKVPWFDSAWDAVHTFVRIPAGALLAASVFADHGTGSQVAALLSGETLAGESHLLKAGARGVINASPEPASNWIASVTEDVVAVGGVSLALWQPEWFLPLLAVLVVCGAVAIYFVWKTIHATFTRVTGSFGGGCPFLRSRQ